MKTITINGDDSKILSVNLTDVLNCISFDDNAFWGILWLDITAKLDNDESVIDLEKRINKSEVVSIVNWNELIKLSSQIIQGINILIVGARNSVSIRNYLTDEEMYANCDYVIELIDSSYWVINTKDKNFAENLFKKLKGVKYE